MATEIEEGKLLTSPRVKFRWCRTVRCQTKEVYLVLTSLTGTQVSLVWKDDLGWYESDLVSLPSGLHSGFLLIREKVKPLVVRHHEPVSANIEERDYKVDPFFITPHKFAIELFLQNNNTTEFWKDHLFLRDRYLSSHYLEELSKRRKEKELEDVVDSLSSRKWSSSHELRKCVGWVDDEKLDPQQHYPTGDGQRQELDRTKPSGGGLHKSKWSSECSSGLGLYEEDQERSNLRKWSSLGDKLKFHSESPDSSYHSRSRTLHIEEEEKEKHGRKIKRHSVDGKKSPISVKSKLNDKTPKQEEDEDSKKRETVLCGRSALSRKVIGDPDLSILKLDTFTQAKAVEALLNQSESEQEEEHPAKKYFFKEVDPPGAEGGYGCLITFESRSASMDDLGSPRALEDVLVSLTSSDTEAKYSDNFKDIEILSVKKTNKSDQVVSLIAKNIPEESYPYLDSEETYPESEVEVSFRSRADEESCRESSDSERNEVKFTESDITINEDENFQYDSLKNDDQKIPLNIRSVLDSEDSLEYCVNVNLNPSSRYSKPGLVVTNDQTLHEITHQPDFNIQIVKLSDTERSTLRESKSSEVGTKSGSYNLEKNLKCPSSSNGEGANDPFVLIHPGSLRSETENGSSGTLKRNKFSESSQSEVEHLKTVRKLSETLRLPKYTLEEKKSKVSSLLSRKRTFSPKKTIVIVRERRPPKMNSTATQTTYRDSFSRPVERMKTSKVKYNDRYIHSSLASKYKENVYSPLPNKVNGPWSAKYDERDSKYSYIGRSNLKNLQRNLHNIVKADQILRKLHPFDRFTNNIPKPAAARFDYLNRPDSRVRKLSFKEKDLCTPMYGPITSTPILNKHSVSFKTPSYTPFTPIRNFQDRHFPNASVRLKEVSVPLLSIYGKDDSFRYRYSNPNQDRDKFSLKASATYSADSTTTLRPVASLPDLRSSHQELSYLRSSHQDLPYLRSSHQELPYSSTPKYIKRFPARATSSPPLNTRSCARSMEERSKPATRDNFRSLRGRSLDDSILLGDSSSGSTDSLIEEANNLTESFRQSREDSQADISSVSFLRSPTRRRRQRTRSSEYLKDPTVSMTPSVSSHIFDSTSFRSESSVTNVLRTRSETDLRMVGQLTGGYQGEPPYLPYRKEHLTMGQIVKVLVPGEGVAMARVVYTPIANDIYQGRFMQQNQDITVVLLSEPTNLSGSVITVPISKILLAWPKA